MAFSICFGVVLSWVLLGKETVGKFLREEKLTTKVHLLDELPDFICRFDMGNHDTGTASVECSSETDFIAFGYTANDH